MGRNAKNLLAFLIYDSLGIAVILDMDFTDRTDLPLDFSVKSV